MNTVKRTLLSLVLGVFIASCSTAHLAGASETQLQIYNSHFPKIVSEEVPREFLRFLDKADLSNSPAYFLVGLFVPFLVLAALGLVCAIFDVEQPSKSAPAPRADNVIKFPQRPRPRTNSRSTITRSNTGLVERKKHNAGRSRA